MLGLKCPLICRDEVINWPDVIDRAVAGLFRVILFVNRAEESMVDGLWVRYPVAKLSKHTQSAMGYVDN